MINSKITVSLPQEKRDVLKSELGKAISILGKPESYLMLGFEDNYDLVNDQFIRRLKQSFPWMNKQERRLAVYIRMGLTSKEIAPLLNISTRGVDMMRYRMREKMELPAHTALKQYFNEL